MRVGFNIDGNTPNFQKAYLYIDKGAFSKQERRVIRHIKNQLRRVVPSDVAHRNYAQWLRDEKNIDIFVSKSKDKRDTIVVTGIVGAKDRKGVLEGFRDLFHVGEYNKKTFNVKDITNSKKKQDRMNIFASTALILTSIFALLLLGTRKISPLDYKEGVQKISVLKDSIKDTLKIEQLPNLLKK